MPGGYTMPGGTAYDEKDWEWVPNDKMSKGGYWKLKESQKTQKSYTCAQYTMAKIQGKAPDLAKKEEADFKESDTQKGLEAKGYKKTDLALCGCEADKQKNCVVIYRDKDGNIFHVAVFDPKRCDWGGKLSGAGTIIRFAHPADYIKRLDADIQDKTTWEVWCKEGAADGYKSDEHLHKEANIPEKKGGGCLLVLLAVTAIPALLWFWLRAV